MSDPKPKEPQCTCPPGHQKSGWRDNPACAIHRPENRKRAEPGPFYWQTITYRDGDLGEQLDRVKAGLEKDARAAGYVVSGWEMSPARVVSVGKEQSGTDKDLQPVYVDKRMCEVTVLALTLPLGPEVWVRLTHRNGPTAAETLTVPAEAIRKLQGLGVKRAFIHPMDIRGVSMGYAQRALEESGQ